MAYKSQAQRDWAHSKEGLEALGPEKVAELDKLSAGAPLPERAPAKPKQQKPKIKKPKRGLTPWPKWKT